MFSLQSNQALKISSINNMGRNTNGLEIVQQKFNQREKVLTICEANEIIGNESINLILALVSSTGSYAIFTLRSTRLPPETISDLTIDKIFPINDYIQIGTVCTSSISQLQFVIKTIDGNSTSFCSTPSNIGRSDFVEFHKEVLIAKSSVINQTDISFSWLNVYQKHFEDLTTIDRRIADGTKTLKKGESKFQDELKKREHEFIIYKDYRIYCATWNINGQPYRESDLSLWLAASEQAPDIYAVALQELDLSPKAITFSESRPDPIWNRKLFESLHKGSSYEELISVRLVGMMLTLFVRKELRPSIIGCKTQSVGTGALNFLGNKGGVAVSLKLNEATLCFVNSHFAAHLNEVESRNQDFSSINRKCIFGDVFERKTISQHDHIFWIGDLNYRIEEYPGLRIDIQNYERMFNYDQLRMEMRKGNVFQGYIEGDIGFRPTYKYDVGTDNYDSSEKSRAPAYCDRILWRGEHISQVTYNSVMEIKQSDHKPVYAEFITGIKTKDQKLYKRVHEDVLKRVDKYENDNQPQITVEKTDIDFGVVTFNEMVIRDFTVANNCHLPVEFSFKQTHENEKEICERWLDVEPKSGSLITGTSLSIRIKFLADSGTISSLLKKLQSSQRQIVDILVLHVKHGHDIFISVIGEYRPSCFGLPVELLCQTNRPICDYTLKEIIDMKDDTKQNKLRVTIPREFFLLIDFLHKVDNKMEGLFSPERKYSKNVQINQIRDWLDSWSNDDLPGNAYTAAEAMLMLLEAPGETLLQPLEEQLLQTATLEEAMELIKLLSPPRQNVFLHLCLFLRDGIDRKGYNLEDTATLFGSILLKKKSEQKEGFRDGRCRLLMLRFLQSDLEKFLNDALSVN